MTWKRRARHTGRVATPEGRLVKSILEVCRLSGAVAYRLNSGVAMLPGRGGVPRPVTFGFRGCPDIVVFLPDGSGRTLWVEAKSARGRLSPAQVAFRDLCRSLNVPWVLARSIDDVLPFVSVHTVRQATVR